MLVEGLHSRIYDDITRHRVNLIGLCSLPHRKLCMLQLLSLMLYPKWLSFFEDSKSRINGNVIVFAQKNPGDYLF